jgi:YesN/AraC family two-component response regulator
MIILACRKDFGTMQLSDQIIVLTSTIFNLNDINTYILKKDGSVLLKFERNLLPPFLLEFQQQDFFTLWEEAEQHTGHCCILTNEFGLTYLASLFTESGEEMKLIVNGPFLRQIPDSKDIKNKNKFNEQTLFIVIQFLRSLKLLSSSKISSMANALVTVHPLHQVPLHSIDTKKKSLEEFKKKDQHKSLRHLDEDYNHLIELRYKTQKELMHAVQMGNKSKLKEALLKAEGLFDFSERLPNHPLRLMKNQLIIVNTFLRIAAEDGKVPPFYLHHISEKFAVQIERIESIEALNKLYHTMFEEYCDLVKNRAVIGYSLLIQQAVSYLSMHYSEPFSLERISEHCHTHPAHLSRQFKKETGMTLTTFMNKRRIEEAKLLLQNELTSIDLISGYVGFNDAVYFASVFKKFEGMTPSEFRNSKK